LDALRQKTEELLNYQCERVIWPGEVYEGWTSKNLELNSKVDVYSVGFILLELLSATERGSLHDAQRWRLINYQKTGQKAYLDEALDKGNLKNRSRW